MAAIVLAAAIGIKALWLLYAWLLSAIVASELSKRKGYGEKWGLGTGMLLSVVGAIIWLLIPPKPDSPWRQKQARKKRAQAATSE
jgi:hypothetical protein